MQTTLTGVPVTTETDKQIERIAESRSITMDEAREVIKQIVDTNSSFSEPESHSLQEGDVVTFSDKPDMWRVKVVTSTQIDFENTNPDASNPSFSHIDFGADRGHLQETLHDSLVSDVDVLRQEQRAESSTNHDEKTFAEQVDDVLNGSADDTMI